MFDSREAYIRTLHAQAALVREYETINNRPTLGDYIAKDIIEGKWK